MVWVVYYLQGLLYEEGTMVSQLMLGLNLGLSIFFAVKVYLRKDLPLYFKGLGALLLISELKRLDENKDIHNAEKM